MAFYWNFIKDTTVKVFMWLSSPPLCQIGRHEYTLSIDAEKAIMRLKCMHCRYESPGWEVSGTIQKGT